MSDTATFPLGQNIPEAELADQFVKLHEEPYGNSRLAFSIVVPNEWLQLGLEAETSELSTEGPKLLTNLLGPEDQAGNAMLQVFGQELVKEVSAADWLKYYLVESGRQPVSLQATSPYFADAVAHWEMDKVAYTMRVAARVAGNRLFLVQAMAPDDLYPDYAETFGLAVASFKVTDEGDNPHVELWQTHKLDEKIVCNAPISWPEQKPECPTGMDAVSLFNLDAQAEPVGVLKIMTLRRELTAGKEGVDLPALLVGEFAKMDVEVAEVISDEPIGVEEPFADARLKTLTARLPKGDDRLRNILVAYCDSPTHHVLVGLLTCAPGEGFYEYAVNRRAFEIVLETLRTE